MSDFQGLRVLVVDDNRHIRMLARQILVAVGAEVSEASSAQEALSRCRALQPDVVLIDFEMPGMTGAAFTAALRAAESSRGGRTAILLMTAHSDARRVNEAVNAGVDGVVAKPISTAVLLQRVAGVRARALAAVDEAAPRHHRRMRGRTP